MSEALAAVALVPGLALGSFLNVVVARVPRRRSIVSPSSACMSCSEAIGWRDNVPLVSYLVLRGKCRNCGVRIGWLYPAVELLTAGLVAASIAVFGLSGRGLIAAFFCAVLVVISAIDLEHRVVPNRIVVPAAAVVLAAQTAIHPSLEWALGSFGAALVLFLAVLAYPKGMGMGDVKLALLLGAALGRTVPVAMAVAMLSALLPAVVLFARHGSAARKHAIPFAPFLALGGVVALFAGAPMLHAYLDLFWR